MSIPAASILATCKCNHCSAEISFPYAGPVSGLTAICPECGMETRLYLPQAASAALAGAIATAPRISSAARKSKKRVFLTVFATVFAGIMLTCAYLAMRNSEAAENVTGVLGLGLLAVGAGVYFLPTLIAHRKRNSQAIFVLNLFLGWTFLGWVIALVWACMRDPDPKTP